MKGNESMEKVKTKLMSLKKYDNLIVNTILTAEFAGFSIMSIASGIDASTNLGAFCSGIVFISSAYLSAKFGKRMYEHYKNDELNSVGEVYSKIESNEQSEQCK